MAPAPIAQKNGTGELRSDPAPLLKRFPLLGRPARVQWMSGTTGDARVPGPSTYWIDALVQLQPEDAARLRRLHQPQADAALPEVVEGLRPLLPAGPWSRSAALDAALSQQGFVARAFLSGDHLVLTALGQ